MNIGISDSSDSQSQNSEILFFTAKLDERARIIVPAPIRRKLGISVGSLVFVGVEKVTDRGSAVDISKQNEGDEYDNE